MMATASPSPHSQPSAVSPPSISPPPPPPPPPYSTNSLPHPSSTPPHPTSPPSLPNASPQDPKTPSNPSPPPPQSPPPVTPPPPPITSTSPPSSGSDPSSNSHSPPLPSQSATPPPPPPLSQPPPQTSPYNPLPPPQLNPPTSFPPPPSTPPPPPSPTPPPAQSSSPPPPATQLPINFLPPPASVPPASVATTSFNVPPLPRIAPPNPPDSQPRPALSSPPVIRLSPPPPSLVSPPCSNPAGNGASTTGGMVAIGVAVGIIVLGLIGLSVWWMRKPRKEICGLNGVYVVPSSLGCSPISHSTCTKTQSAASLLGSGYSSGVISLPSEPSGIANSRPCFAFEELVKATNGFSSENLLGEGGFGCVYKGYLPDGRDGAVKQLKVGAGQGEREFKAEVEIISRIHHRHLVSLVGYCISESWRFLVYDYVPNKTLHFHLHGDGEGRPVLDWATRVRIAAGAARGIAYLHEDCHPRIIHTDIKSSNILLDKNFEAKVSDFGLAKLALDTNKHVTTHVMGTFGYMAPEYALSGKLTEKSDVYSFGVVLLELITGRKPVDASQSLGEGSLVQWARPLLSCALENEEFESLADPRLGKNYIESEMFHMMEAAAACVRHSAAKRPRMGQVVRAFDGLAIADVTNGMGVAEIEVFYSAQESEEIRMFQRMSFGSESYSTDFFSQGSLDS